MAKEITIYRVVVIEDHDGNSKPYLCVALAKETARQIRIIKRLRGAWGVNAILEPHNVHRTAEEAIKVWRRSVERDMIRHTNLALDCETLLTKPIHGYPEGPC